jgi:hypothetical protein
MKTIKAFRLAWRRAAPVSALGLLWAAGCREATKDDWPASDNAATSAGMTSSGPGTASMSPAMSSGSTVPADAGTAELTDEAGAGMGGGAPADAAAPLSTDAGLPPGASQIAGIEFFRRIVGVWSGINSNTPLGFNFPMTVEFSPSGPSFVFAKYELDSKDDVCWGFNIETYGGDTVLAFRNGGYLGGALRDSRLKLMDHNTAAGTYHFCAVLESGVPVSGCNYIDATYTFLAPDHMTFVVTTMSGKPHVNWDAMRTQVVSVPDPFPASIVSQGDGSMPWPPAAGIPTRDF